MENSKKIVEMIVMMASEGAVNNYGYFCYCS